MLAQRLETHPLRDSAARDHHSGSENVAMLFNFLGVLSAIITRIIQALSPYRVVLTAVQNCRTIFFRQGGPREKRLPII